MEKASGADEREEQVVENPRAGELRVVGANAEGSLREEEREGAGILALEIPPPPQGFLFGASSPFDQKPNQNKTKQITFCIAPGSCDVCHSWCPGIAQERSRGILKGQRLAG